MQDQGQDEDALNRKSGRIFLFSLIAFFVVFASVDAFFVFKALSTHTGVVAENAYEIGLNYNDVIEEAKKQREQETHDSGSN
tara:strand:- start:250 stop:495 length:246 start_codon:yes stop_codon:yes gene_type:complete